MAKKTATKDTKTTAAAAPATPAPPAPPGPPPPAAPPAPEAPPIEATTPDPDAVAPGHVRLQNLLPHKANTAVKVSDPAGIMVEVKIDARGRADVPHRVAGKLLQSNAWKRWEPGDSAPIKSSLKLIDASGAVMEVEKDPTPAPTKKPYIIGQPPPPPQPEQPAAAAPPPPAVDAKPENAQADPDAAPPAETEALYPNVPGPGEVWPAPTNDMSMDYLLKMADFYEVKGTAKTPKQALITKLEEKMFE